MTQTANHLDSLDFDQLVQQVRACTLCKDVLPEGPRPVVQLSRSSRILVVGQAPGRKVHETGIPFNDPSGDRLRQWMGVDREQFYNEEQVAILPMGFCFPGTGKSGDLPPRPECAETWREALLARLDKVELTLVIGQYAQAWHLPDSRKSVTDNVKAWREYWPGLLPMPHPSPRNIRWLKSNPWFEQEVIPRLQARIRELL
ncbi:uracil-DNA glycosylase family protein [Marinobacter sp. UBA3607]|jgi:uracil-DNA glycosylase|uniref:uracil-DNA glycosylase family protein n=1 Tax=Marinobacter sp. UBA3607 TaxID=1946820 RepID=UPI000E965BFE|nr:uracil-DNA glycosylase family protein [Marinobacter sp. UBA3607]HBM51260.1 uracil-DNA glycosylase [Marinobacter sp.]|tara:strand:- start:26943 stop:27545 length:603 start_codon:yes stop_codon:yes gene_type:complete